MTKTIEITMEGVDGRTYGFVSQTEKDAKFLADGIFPDCVFSDQWDQMGEGESRLLIWESEEDAENDSGEKAIAMLIRNKDA